MAFAFSYLLGHLVAFASIISIGTTTVVVAAIAIAIAIKVVLATVLGLE